ncbi:MAG: hypothetical protein JJD98_05960 [Polaromonas sp.]|nr:hypothetical protein [Polaromonas sp.]
MLTLVAAKSETGLRYRVFPNGCLLAAQFPSSQKSFVAFGDVPIGITEKSLGFNRSMQQVG